MSDKKPWSHTGSHFFLSRYTTDNANGTTDEVPLSGPIYTVCEVMLNAMASSAEAEIFCSLHKCTQGRGAAFGTGGDGP
eukprot:5647158-Ditylum_brightwellii.AAC.1